MDRDCAHVVNVLAEVMKLPDHVLTREVNSAWTFERFPGESESDEEPPVRLTDDSEVIAINGVLGSYTPETRHIIIFRKGIQRVAQRLGAGTTDLKFVVRLHEWAHALIHLGVPEAVRQHFIRDKRAWPKYLKQATAAFRAQDLCLHEAFAQLLTYHSLRSLQEATTLSEACAMLERIEQTFHRLTRMAPREYHIHRYTDVPKHRLIQSIGLVKSQTLIGLAAWETVIKW